MKIIYLLFFLAFSSNVLACNYKKDNRSWHERLEEIPMVFIGTVTEVTDEKVVFHVENMVKGDAVAQYTLSNKSRNTTCHINYVKGQRWLYAGDVGFSPSIQLHGALSIIFNSDYDAIYHNMRKENCDKIIRNKKVTNLLANFFKEDIEIFYENPAWNGVGFKIQVFPNISIKEQLNKMFMGEEIYKTYQKVLLDNSLPDKKQATKEIKI